MTQTIYSDIIFSGNIYKDRTSVSERQRFSIPFYEEQEVVNVNLSPKLLGEAVQSLKDSILKELTVEKIVKKCAFERF